MGRVRGVPCPMVPPEMLTPGPLSMEVVFGDSGDGTATVIVVSCSGSPSPSLIVSVAIFDPNGN